MSNPEVSIANLIKGAQSDALNEVLAAIRGSGDFDESQLEQLTTTFDAYKTHHLTIESEKKGKTRAAKDKPKRAFVPNGYTVFSKENRPAIIAANPGTATKDVMGLLGDAWKALSLEEKEEYKVKAKTGASASSEEEPVEKAAPVKKPVAKAASEEEAAPTKKATKKTSKA